MWVSFLPLISMLVFLMIIVYIIFIDPKIEKAKKSAEKKEGENA